MKRNVSWVWVLLGLIVLSVVALVSLPSGGGSGGGFGDHVAIVSLSGPISDSESASLLGGRSGGSRSFTRDLEEAARNPLAKAIVVRINSPGGSPSASQEMYRAVLRAREKKKVYASMGDAAASGGYYVAAACDKIYANPSTLTGSIGVIQQLVNYQELLRKVGLGTATVKSGRFKDLGSPTRPLTPADRALLQAMNRDIYEQFVDDVVAGRKGATSGRLTKAKLLPLADGRVFTGRQALRAGLVDALGGLHEAVQDAGKAAGIEGEVASNDIERPSLFGGLLGASASAKAQGAAGEVGAALGRSFAQGMAAEMAAQAKSVAGAPQVKSEW